MTQSLLLNTPLNDYALRNDLGAAAKLNRSKAEHKGLVQQPNGNWGAQIYSHRTRFWLGTFKSADEAAAAYHKTSIQILEFEELYTTEAMSTMVRDGSHQRKFREFQRMKSSPTVERIQELALRCKDEKFSRKLLFEKELTSSDVGILNRLVIPRRYAVKYLPFKKIDQNKREKGELGAVEDVEVVFYDKDLVRQWKFKYCYWTSSKSFVFTSGWKGFVKDKRLKEKDVVVFYSCVAPRNNVETLEDQSETTFFMIDVQKKGGIGNLVVPDDVNKTVAHDSSDEAMKNGNVYEETKSKENKAGFMLFGVWIQ